MIHLDLATAVKLVREAVAEKGADFIYPHHSDDPNGPTCLYAVRNEEGEPVPDCIVGHVFNKLNFPMGWFLYTPGGANSYSVGAADYVLANLQRDEKLAVDRDAAIFLKKVQSWQDWRRTWGYALSAALEELGTE